MGLIAKDTGGADFKPAPAGTHVGVCVSIIDLGTQTTPFKNDDGSQKIAHQCFIQWELPSEIMEDGKPFTVGKFYTISLHEKANLRHDLEAWRGQPFTDEELKGFALAKILGKPCMVNVGHKLKADKSVSAIVNGVVAMPKGMPVPAPTNDLVMFDIDQWDQKVFDGLAEYWQKQILASMEGAKHKASNGAGVKGIGNEDIDESSIPF